MRCLLIVVVILIVGGYASAQTKREADKALRKLEGDYATFKGHITLTDGTEDDGMIAYNDKTAIVSFKDGDKTGTYNARNLVAFDFYDPDSRQQRKFFSMEYEMREGGQKTDQFFEIVREYKDFAVLIKTDPVTFKKKVGVVEATVLGDYERTRVEATQAITVYLINENLGVRPYLEFRTKDVTHFNNFWNWHMLDGTFTRLTILDRGLPKELMGDNYKKVDKYAEKNGLDWDEKDDLVSIMDYYESLID